MGTRRERGLSASWEHNDVLIFCDLCIKEIQIGNRPTTHFNKEGWKHLIIKFKAITGKALDQAQLKNKWDQLKKDWKVWRELKRGETGLGWNPIKKTIDASDEWWTEKTTAIPAAKKFRYAGISPDLEEKLDIMFSSVVATGDDVWMPSSGVMPSDGLSDHNESDDGDNMVTDSASHGGRTDGVGCAASKQSQGESSTRKTNSGGSKRKSTHKSELVGYVKELVGTARDRTTSTIKQAYEELAKYPAIYDNLDFYNFATDFVLDRNRREGFMNCPDDRKVWWLRTRYEKSLE